MAVEYNQHTWGYGEELTPDKFNNIEGGVKANADAINEVNNNLIPLLKIQFDDEYKNAKPCKFLNACWYNNEYNYGFTFVFGASSIGNYVEDTYWLAIRHDGLLGVGIQINNAVQPKWYVK